MNATNTASAAGELWQRARAYAVSYMGARFLWERRLRPEERQKLGATLDDAINAHENAVKMWRKLYPVSEARATIEVARRIEFLTEFDADLLLREVGELPRDPEEAKDLAIERGDLVLVRHSREVFWNGEQVSEHWFKKGEEWEFLLVACEHAMRNESLDRWSFGEGAHADAVSKKKSRLKAVSGFPPEIVRFFKVTGKRTQKFTLDAERIHIATN